MSKVLPQFAANTSMMSSAVASKTMTSSAATQQAKTCRPKKVEVRWLESESELYLKQWQRRYHQLEGLDNNYHQLVVTKNGRQLSGEEFGDWCLTSTKTLLDLDFDTINTNNNNIIISNSNPNSDPKSITAFDHFFWRSDEINGVVQMTQKKNNNNNKRFKGSQSSSVFGFNDNKSLSLSLSSRSAVDDEDGVEENGYVIRRRLMDAIDAEDESTAAEDSLENIRITSIKRFVNNSKIKSNNSFSNRNKNDIIVTEKERQFSIDLNKRLELLAKDQSMANGGDPAAKARPPKSRQRDRTRPPRPRPPPIRRQIFKCEHIGCSYQSDRNFNFLRHKRTHRKAQPEDESGADTGTGGVAAPVVLADVSAKITLQSTDTLVNEINQKSDNNSELNTSNTLNTSVASICTNGTGSAINGSSGGREHSLKTSTDSGSPNSCDNTCIDDINHLKTICDVIDSHSYHQNISNSITNSLS